MKIIIPESKTTHIQILQYEQSYLSDLLLYDFYTSWVAQSVTTATHYA